LPQIHRFLRIKLIESTDFTKDKCCLALIAGNAVRDEKQENGSQKKPEPFASNNKKCYTFVFQIFLG
jgi:hypothetical protein